jgi:hypothetical protein
MKFCLYLSVAKRNGYFSAYFVKIRFFSGGQTPFIVENHVVSCEYPQYKEFHFNDLSRPALPVHPNCRCNYVELNKKNSENFAKRSITVHVADSPDIGGIKISRRKNILPTI